MKLSTWAKERGISYRTAWRYFKDGKIKGAYQMEMIIARTSKGMLINTDVNGSLNIMKKGIPNAFCRWDTGCCSSPIEAYPS